MGDAPGIRTTAAMAYAAMNMSGPAVGWSLIAFWMASAVCLRSKPSRLKNTVTTIAATARTAIAKVR